jgi:hypothetical protein
MKEIVAVWGLKETIFLNASILDVNASRATKSPVHMGLFNPHVVLFNSETVQLLLSRNCPQTANVAVKLSTFFSCAVVFRERLLMFLYSLVSVFVNSLAYR